MRMIECYIRNGEQVRSDLLFLMSFFMDLLFGILNIMVLVYGTKTVAKQQQTAKKYIEITNFS